LENKDWINDNWWTSEFNFEPDFRETLSLPAKVQIHDATLRDGEQTPGLVLRKEHKIEIAQMLDELGVDRIEAGMPAVSREDFEALRDISKLGLKSKIMAFSRAMTKDVDLALECGVYGVVIEIASGLPRIKYQYTWDENETIHRAIEAINYAKKKGLFVNFFPFETTRAEKPFLMRFLDEVKQNASPDSIAVIDTTGCILPSAMRKLVLEIKARVNLPIEVHTHNDFGMAVAVSLAAVESGAEVVHTCINGLGERCGNASIDEVAVCLKTLYGLECSIRLDKLYKVSRRAQEISGIPMAPNKPLVGEGAFLRESGLGVKLLKTNPTVLFAINPRLLGRNYELGLGKKSGKESIRFVLEELGIGATDEQVQRLLSQVKEMGTECGRLLTREEFRELVKKEVGT
jgi:methanogen homocitrate synthase